MGSGGSLSFIGAVGVVAQQGNQAVAGCSSAPSGVSLATASSGNYDDAVFVYSILLGSSGEDNLDSNDGSDFSYSAPLSTATIDFAAGPDYEAMLNNNSGVLRFGCRGYIRESSASLPDMATSWEWQMKSLTYDDSSQSAVSSVSIGGTASTSQDAISSGTGEYAQITHASGGRGYLQMTNGDYLEWDVRAQAINACGSTWNSPTLRVKIEWG